MKKRYLGQCVFCFTAFSFCAHADDLPASRQGQESSGLCVDPSIRFEVDRGWNLFLNTEFLWWVAKEDGLYYAQSRYSNEATTAIPSDGMFDFKGHLQRVKPLWQPAFRLGFGGNMSYDEWDLFLNWTWFSSEARNTSKGSLLCCGDTPISMKWDLLRELPIMPKATGTSSTMSSI